MVMYKIVVSQSQAELLAQACEFFSRIGIGQLEFLLEHQVIESKIGNNRRELESYISVLKRILFERTAHSNASILSDEVPDRIRRAWDLNVVIRYRLAWDKAGNPARRRSDMFGVWYDEPRHTSKEPLATITSENEWRSIDSAPRVRNEAGEHQIIFLTARYPIGGATWTDLVQSWWVEPAGENDGFWARWNHQFPPTHWMKISLPPGDKP